jgi:glycosyltransferase involved in cell wall biosynthesis
MILITAAIITFNEEKNIQRCIESLLPVADEILIVDSFSKDKTKEIACAYEKVRFVENPFEGHIQQKNYALQLAKNEWVISLDADEALTEELTYSIIEAFKNPVASGYTFNRLTNYCGHWVKHCGWYPDKKLRIVKKSNAKWDGENPHDYLTVEANDKIIHLKGDLLHYSYYSAEQHYKQIEYFGDIAAHAAYRKGKRTNYILIGIKTGFQLVKSYILKLGFLDGKTGWLISKRSAYATYRKYSKLLKLQQSER